MTEQLQDIRAWIDEGKTDAAIEALNDFIRNDRSGDDKPFYLLGNAYRKRGDWQQALNHYAEAICRNPESPAASAREMVMDILNFYNKDMYNQ